ncbi:DUF4910 domain-containing protein [Mesorhizobium sp. LSHC414A00]|uniref:DUF4910 domain-containing protein n=1 Tax=Mesorhizobium sp. LSHC414A00 TaxID=1287287 RepID=UPI0012EB8425|nr:DUF4910 domain-containing protein [Mesorhizobium sp. LSHC414A00]
MRLLTTDLVGQFIDKVPLTRVMSAVAEVSRYDRYQASLGLQSAAVFVAEAASAAGLQDVSIEHFPADARQQWWGFRAPRSWTPTSASLSIETVKGVVLKIDHARQPCSIATYSAATPSGGLTARLLQLRAAKDLGGDLARAVVLVDKAMFSTGLLAELAARNAAGVLTDAANSTQDPTGVHSAGRIELDLASPLFAFSLPPPDYRLACDAAPAEIKVVVDVDRSAGMPVVTGILPGTTDDREVWLVAHLCHPRPGANDNASGVAALLGVIAAESALRRDIPIRGDVAPVRFVWGPEFLGAVALLHQRVQRLGPVAIPSATINCDMVGGNQGTGGPFILERPPDSIPSLLAPLAEHCLAQAFALTAAHPGLWGAKAFQGFSDHALFADPNIACPAVQFCHRNDPYNHTGADSLDKISPVEMTRAVSAAGALARIMRRRDALYRADAVEIVRSWCERENAAALAVAIKHAHVEGGRWARGYLDHIVAREASLKSLLDPDLFMMDSALRPPLRAGSRGQPVTPSWSGPLNVRGMLNDLPKVAKTEIDAVLRANRDHHALFFQFASLMDGRRSRKEILEAASYAVGHPLDRDVAARLFDVFLSTKKAVEVRNTPESGSRISETF